MPVLVDSHCHLNLLTPDSDRTSVSDVIADARAHGVGHMLCVSVDLESFPVIRDYAGAHECVSASLGLHPNHRPDIEPELETLTELAADPEVVAIGETGLDYFHSTGDLEWQRDRFRRHVAAAKACGKPLIIHCRDAKEDTLRILGEERADEVGGVMHCFVEDWDAAQCAMDLDFDISFSGIVTFKNAAALKEVAARVPLDRMLIETDCPYLAPVPHRGKPNYPAYVRFVAEYIAGLKGVTFDTVAETTTRNFFARFPDARPSFASS